ncbi:hypothetical protein FACS189449_13490 [Alphaproteobacteria bacterium]|nr:hypothetical protein FACS189449_13490 [Alphaproteobacteria bacterium]
MQNHVIGVDVSKETLDICAIFDGKIRGKTFENTEAGFKNLITWIAKLGLINPHICMESTGCYSEASAEFLHNSGYGVSVVNPLPIKAFRTSKMVRQKTDKSDAKIIANFCLQNDPKLWTPKPRENKELHEINIRIDALKVELNRLTNTLERKILNAVVKKSIDDEIAFVKSAINTLEDEAKKLIENSETLKKQSKLLTGIKGVGPKMALTIFS